MTKTGLLRCFGITFALMGQPLPTMAQVDPVEGFRSEVDATIKAMRVARKPRAASMRRDIDYGMQLLTEHGNPVGAVIYVTSVDGYPDIGFARTLTALSDFGSDLLQDQNVIDVPPELQSGSVESEWTRARRAVKEEWELYQASTAIAVRRALARIQQAMPGLRANVELGDGVDFDRVSGPRRANDPPADVLKPPFVRRAVAWSGPEVPAALLGLVMTQSNEDGPDLSVRVLGPDGFDQTFVAPAPVAWVQIAAEKVDGQFFDDIWIPMTPASGIWRIETHFVGGNETDVLSISVP